MIIPYVPPAGNYIEPENAWPQQPGKEGHLSSDLFNHVSSSTLI